MKGNKIKATLLIAVFIISTLAMAMPLMLVSAAAPVIYYVDWDGGNDSWEGNATHPWDTITHALATVSAGDTIIVEAGTYDHTLGETFPLTIVDENVTIKSADGSTTTIISAIGSADSICVFNITADNVTIGGNGVGFTAKGGAPLTGDGVGTPYDPAYAHVIDVSADYATIQGNKIINKVGNVAGIHISHSYGTGHLIKGNTFRSASVPEGWGIMAENLSSSVIEDNFWTADNHTEGIEGNPGTCIVINDADNVNITGNTASYAHYTFVIFQANYPRLDAGNKMYDDCRNATITNVRITDNTVHHVGDSKGKAAIRFDKGAKSGQPEGWTPAANLTIGTGVSITGNYFYNNGMGIEVSENETEGGMLGAVFGAENLEIFYNDIYDSVYEGILNEQAGILNATLNWWGDPAGPWYVDSTGRIGAGDNITKSTYIPWLSTSIDDDYSLVSENPELDEMTYKTGDPVLVTVYDGSYNADPIRKETIDINATSTTDIAGISVELEETGVDTGIFTATFPLVAPVPAPSIDELGVNEDDTVTITYYTFTDTAVVDDSSPTVSVTALETIIGVNKTNVLGSFVDDNIHSIYVGTVNATLDLNAKTFTASNVPLVYGNNTLTAIATDWVGLTGSDSTWIVYDNVGPVVADPLATPPKAIATGETTLSVSVTDEWVNISSVSVNLTAIGGIVTQAMAFNTSGTDLWEYTATVGALIDPGIYYLNITATDDLSNANSTEFFTFEVVTDAIPPVMGEWDVDYPTGKINAREGDVVNVTVVATDLPAGVSYVEINGTEITGTTGFVPMARIGTTDSYYKDLTVTSDVLTGTYYLNITATDYADNSNSTLATVLIQELATMEMYTLSTDYDPGDIVDFYVNASFAFDLTIEILDPTEFLYTTITCSEADHWIRVMDYSIVPYEASFDLPSTAASGTWNWTAFDGTEEVANGTFAVGVAEPQPDIPAETTDQEPLDSNGAPKTSFVLGETVLASSTVTNIGTQSQQMLIIVQWKDPDLRALAPVFLLVELDPGDDFTYMPGLILPTTGYTTGTWTASILVLTTWPAQGGVAIGVPVTITITVS